MDLGSLKQIARLDKENMLDLLISFPRQCEDAVFIAERVGIRANYRRNYSHVVFTGLGGSAIGADFVRNYISHEIALPVFVNRNYALPEFVNNASLVFAVSYSGNTEETLEAYSDAKKRRASVVAITSGGKLKEHALKNGDTLVSIPKGYPPRCALGYTFIPAIMILSKLGLVKAKKGEIKKAVQVLDALAQRKLAPHIAEEANTSKRIARRVHRRFPVIYSSSRLDSIATRWRG
jgi:glucose/mannose-6-phosphate isomerase